MQFSVETIEGLKRRLTVTISGKEIALERDKRLKELAKGTYIAGFRPGKVPIALIQKRFGPQVQQEVMDHLIQTHLTEIVSQNQFRAVSAPVLENISEEGLSNGDVRCMLTFEVFPEVNLDILKELVITKPDTVIHEADVDLMIDSIRRQRQTWSTVADRPAMLGDRLKVDFTGVLTDGTDFSGNTGTDVFIILGQGMFVGGFERHLVGAVAGETRTVEVTFPLGYHNTAVANKSALFTVLIKSVESAELPELSEEFIRTFGVTEGTIDAFRHAVSITMEKDFAKKAWISIKTQVLEQLYQRYSDDLPNSLVENELKRLSANLPVDQTQDQNPELMMQARRNITMGIIIGDLARRQNFQADPERVREYVRNLAEDYEDPNEVERFWLSDKNRLQEVEAVVLEDIVVEWILGQVELQTKLIPFSAWGTLA